MIDLSNFKILIPYADEIKGDHVFCCDLSAIKVILLQMGFRGVDFYNKI